MIAAGSPTRARLTLAAGIGLALAILAGAILGSVLHLRDHIRAQIAGRDGESLQAVAAAIYHDDKTNEETIAALDDPGEQIQLVLKVARMRDVLGVRLYSSVGGFVNAFPAYITEAALPAEDLAALRELRPVSHFLPQARLEQQVLFAESSNAPSPLLEVNLPLHEEGEKRLAGVAQFLINGTSIAAEYAQLDRHLALEGMVVFVLSGALLVLGLALAFGRLQRANRLLAERTSNLLKANRELALAARTSAVGTVTSHLIHGLKNPLSGLHSFVQDRASGESNGEDGDWKLAVATTQRMEDLINRVVRVLQERPAAAVYEISFEELAELARDRLQATAGAAAVRFESTVTVSGTLSNHEADLVLLILENLVQNAIEATPAGGRVRLFIFAEGGRVALQVQDEGPGLPSEVAEKLFTPCAPGKKSGSGIGLAISRQLALHLGADLELKLTSPQGCIFQLTLPPPAADGEKRELEEATSG